MAVLFAQPTDVVKVRLQAGSIGRTSVRYSSTLQAYKNIAAEEGTRGLWKGTSTSQITCICMQGRDNRILNRRKLLGFRGLRFEIVTINRHYSADLGLSYLCSRSFQPLIRIKD